MIERMTAIALWALIFLGQSPLFNNDCDVKRIGFQHYQEASRIFITTHGHCTPQIKHIASDIVRVTLPNGTIPLANDRRPLDTRYFDSAVLWIAPQHTTAESPTVWIDIFLKAPDLPFTHDQREDLITMDFAHHQ